MPSFEMAPQRPYTVLIVESDGYAQDPRGDFASYDDAYDAFEKSVRFIDDLSSKVNDYPLTLDTVQMTKAGNLILIWQRPPWRTERLLREWAMRDGDAKVTFTRGRFVAVATTAQQTVATDRKKTRSG